MRRYALRGIQNRWLAGVGTTRRTVRLELIFLVGENAMHARYIGGIVGGAVWCVLLYLPFARWAVSFFPGHALWYNAVYGLGGILGIVAFIWVGVKVGDFLDKKFRR